MATKFNDQEVSLTEAECVLASDILRRVRAGKFGHLQIVLAASDPDVMNTLIKKLADAKGKSWREYADSHKDSADAWLSDMLATNIEQGNNE